MLFTETPQFPPGASAWRQWQEKTQFWQSQTSSWSGLCVCGHLPWLSWVERESEGGRGQREQAEREHNHKTNNNNCNSGCWAGAGVGGPAITEPDSIALEAETPAKWKHKTTGKMLVLISFSEPKLRHYPVSLWKTVSCWCIMYLICRWFR